MNLAVLLIDDAADFRVLCTELIRAHWPQAAVEHWDPLRQGVPAADCDLSRYDVILLDLKLGEEDGMDWLQQLRARADCPPIVIITGTGSEVAVLKAMRGGAIDYIPKASLSVERLAEAMGDALARKVLPGARRAPAAKFSSPHLKIEGYRTLREISVGTTSMIYLGERRSDGRKVAIKFLRSRFTQNKDAMQRFARERDMVRRLNSAHLARVYAEKASPNQAYIVMEYCDGGDLNKRIVAGIEPAHALELLFQIAAALADVHDQGIVHRDLKPANILFRGDGSLVIMDFGIAKLVVDDARITQVPSLIGTPYYMSPEQAAGKPIDQRSDLYSAGVIFFEMLTGAKPYPDANYLLVIDKHLHAPVPRLPPEFAQYQDLVDRLLAKQPEDRFRDAHELRSHLAARFGVRAEPARTH